MNYFSTAKPVSDTRDHLKSLKAHDYEYCILAMKDNSTIVLSNSESLTHQLQLLTDDFKEIKIPKKEFCSIYNKELYYSSQGNHSLLLEEV